MSALTSITKPSLIDQIPLINEVMPSLTNPIKNIDDIETILTLDESEGITKIEMMLNKLETIFKLLSINEDEPYKDGLYHDILSNIGTIFNHFDKIKLLNNEYNDFPVSELHILKDVKKIVDPEFNDMVVTRLNEKKERELKCSLRGINIHRIEIIKLLIFTKEILNKLIKRDSSKNYGSGI
jgi:hypothetical protein